MTNRGVAAGSSADDVDWEIIASNTADAITHLLLAAQATRDVAEEVGKAVGGPHDAVAKELRDYLDGARTAIYTLAATGTQKLPKLPFSNEEGSGRAPVPTGKGKGGGRVKPLSNREGSGP
jgi:hypothetical protein